MTSVKTESVSRKLEQIIDFRVGEEALTRHPIVAKKGMTPATDGHSVFLPEEESIFGSERDNELALANFTAHESDHIVEYGEYFEKDPSSFAETGSNAVQEYHQRNYAELTENPALAGWIDNVVKDHRIDSRRRQLSGVDRFYKETLNPATKYLRPSIVRMSELDAFREQFLQQTLIGETVESVPKEKKELLEEAVRLAKSSGSIQMDPEVVKQIYRRLKDNFDITKKISRLPPRYNTGDNSRTKGSPQQGYQGQTQPREGRDPNDKKPKQLSEKARDGKKLYEPDKDSKDKKGSGKDENEESTLDERGKEELYKRDRNALYTDLTEKHGIDICPVANCTDKKIQELLQKRKLQYAGEIESTRRIFRQLKLRHYGVKRDFEGAELDYEEFMQGELESKVTGVRRERRVFIKDTQNQQRPAWAVLADISPSTDPEYFNIIDGIKSSLLIQGEALGDSDYPFGLFAFSGDLYVLKDFTEKYSESVARKILSVRRSHDGTALAPSLEVVAGLLDRQLEQPKGITIITDGDANLGGDPRPVIQELYKRKIHPFLIVLGKEFEKYAKHLTGDIGNDHYVIVERDKLHELPGEMFRLFKTYGIAK